MKKVVEANKFVRSESDHHFYLRYDNIYVQQPSIEEDHSDLITSVTPMECRLRDLTYAATICVDVTYKRGVDLVEKKGVQIGRLPIMLHSERCLLHNKSDAELAELREVRTRLLMSSICTRPPTHKAVRSVHTIPAGISSSRVLSASS